MALSLPSNTQTIFNFSLPYAIPVPDGDYRVNLRNRIATLTIKRVQKEHVGGFVGTGTMQLNFDKYGWSAYSSIKLTLPWLLDWREQGRTPVVLGKIPPRRRAKEIALDFLNRFIETVRYTTKEFWIESARYQDIMAYDIYYWDGGKMHLGMKTLMDTGVGGLRLGIGHPFAIDEKQMKQLNDLLLTEGELDTSILFILGAKDACLQEDFRVATIESVTALEIVLSNFIKKQGKKLRISKKELNNFIKEVGLTGNISIVLKMLTKGLEQIDDDTIATCKGAITTRNKILHEGLREVYSTDAEKRIVAIEKMLEYLGRLSKSQ